MPYSFTMAARIGGRPATYVRDESGFGPKNDTGESVEGKEVRHMDA
jgi:hypothetical protein